MPYPQEVTEDRIKTIAYTLYLNRKFTAGYTEDADSDWRKAKSISQSPVRHFLFRINQVLIDVEKRKVEPVARWIDRADIFRIIERLSPAIEALGVIAIPIVLFFATQNYQEELQQQAIEQRRQQAVREYFNQLSNILLEVDGDLREPKNNQLRVLTTSATLTVLREPNLDGFRKGEIIRFLANTSLVNTNLFSPPLSDDQRPTISLYEASLSGANLEEANLGGANLGEANLSNANLKYAVLTGTYLNKANLSNANLETSTLRDAKLAQSNLQNADLTGADLTGAILLDADLRNARLGGLLNDADFSRANLQGASFTRTTDDEQLGSKVAYIADMDGARLNEANMADIDLSEIDDLTQEQVSAALLCRTVLPSYIQLSPNRDCKVLEEQQDSRENAYSPRPNTEMGR